MSIIPCVYTAKKNNRNSIKSQTDLIFIFLSKDNNLIKHHMQQIIGLSSRVIWLKHDYPHRLWDYKNEIYFKNSWRVMSSVINDDCVKVLVLHDTMTTQNIKTKRWQRWGTVSLIKNPQTLFQSTVYPPFWSSAQDTVLLNHRKQTAARKFS